MAMSETLPMVKNLLGHARIDTTALYAHLDDGQILEATEHVGQLIVTAMGEIDRYPPSHYVGQQEADE